MNDKLTLTDLFKQTIAIMQAVEAVYPQGGKGQEKFDAVYAQVMAYAPLVNVAAGVLDALLPLFINNTVTLFNRLGLFRTTTAA